MRENLVKTVLLWLKKKKGIWSVLATFLLLYKIPWPRQPVKVEVCFWLKVPEWRLYHHCGEQTWQRSPDMVAGTAGSSHLEPQAENRESNLNIRDFFWNLKALEHASSRKNPWPNPSQAVSPTTDQIIIQVPENMGEFSVISSQKVGVYHPVCTDRVQYSK